MKTFLFNAALVITIMSSYGVYGFTQDTSAVSAYFIGSHGFLLESSGKKVMLDATIYWTGDNYGYIKPPVPVKNRIENAQAPFDSIDLFLVSHAHTDHYNISMLEKAMLLNKNASLVVPEEVYTELVAGADSLSKYSDRIWVPQIPFYNTRDTVISGIPLTITNIEHSSINLFTYVIELDGIRFLQLNEWNSITNEMYDTLGFNKTRADVGLLGYNHILDATNLAEFQNKIRPVFTTICHVDGATGSRLSTIQTKIAQLKSQFPMNMLTVPMEQLNYRKVNDTILVDTLNLAPGLNSNLMDTLIETNTAFSLSIPPAMFGDKDGDTLAVRVALSNDAALPGWLVFNPQALTFTGTPQESGVYSVKITAADPDGAEVSDVFKVTVSAHSALENPDKERVRIYPCPAAGRITVSLINGANHEAVLNVYDISGKSLFEAVRFAGNELTLDLSGYPKGIYILNVNIDGELIRKELFLK